MRWVCQVASGKAHAQGTDITSSGLKPMASTMRPTAGQVAPLTPNTSTT